MFCISDHSLLFVLTLKYLKGIPAQPPRWTLNVNDKKRQTTEYGGNLVKQWEGLYQSSLTASYASDTSDWSYSELRELAAALSCGFPLVRMRGPSSISSPAVASEREEVVSDSEPAAAPSVTLLLMHARG